MAKPNKVPTWATDGGAEVTEPSAGKRAIGWILERPAYQYFNWLFNLIGQWLGFLDSQFAADGVKRVAEVADLTALKALVPADGDVCRIAAAVYVFKAGDATTADDVLVVADDGGTGRWLHVAQPVANVAKGLARLTTTNTRPLYVELSGQGGPAIFGKIGDDDIGNGVEGHSGKDGGVGVRGVNRRPGGGVGVAGIGSDGETGSGDGVNGIGGADGGVGVYGEASANNDAGVEGKGHGTGAGVKGTGATGVEGVVASGSANGDGVKGTGKGTGAGMRATGGMTGTGIIALGGTTSGPGVVGTAQGGNSNGIEGNGRGTGAGVKGTGGANGPGVYGESSGIGVGGEFKSSGSRGAINIAYDSGNGALPTAAAPGDMLYDEYDHKLWVFVGGGGGWKEVTVS